MSAAGEPPRRPLVTVVVPVRNESATVESMLDGLAEQSLGPAALEVLVYDGRSTDGTDEICRAAGARHSWGRFAVLDNPARTVPYALNAGLRASTCEWFTRLDGRTRLSPDYLELCIRCLCERPGEALAVGGQFSATARGRVPEAIAAAVTHPLGVGRGFRTPVTSETVVPHHPFAVWPTDGVRAVGGFDESLTRNQDDEFSMRAVARGWRTLVLPQARVVYRPRERLRGLAAQYFQYGLWKAAVGRRHGRFPVRSLVPAGPTLLLGPSAFALARGRPAPALGFVAAYAFAGGIASRRRRDADPLLTAAALGVVHLSYGAGVLAGALAPDLVDTPMGTARVR
ncbi:MAG: glycosyltransferase [Actinomycetota bacterium]|nr:glycosyltransferase [Actinomycetota bacterium]